MQASDTLSLPLELTEHVLAPLGTPAAAAASSAMQASDAAKEIMRIATSSLQCPAPSSPPKHDEKSKELAAWFGIPGAEPLLNDFHCALRRRVLLQGRLFVFERHVCFNTNVFGYVKKIVIPLAQVESVTKKTHCRFPNSIEIEDTRGDRSFFTSFLTRDSAFRTVVNAWGQIRPDVVEQLLAALDEEPCRPASTPSASPPTKKVSMLFFKKKKQGAQQLLLDQGCEPGPAQAALQALVEAGGTAHGLVVDRLSAPEDAPSSLDGLQRRNSLTFMDGKLDDPSHCSEAMWSSISEAAPPSLPKHAKLLLSTSVPGSPRDFFDLLIADDSPFMEDVLLQLGNRSIDIASWKPADLLGHIRNVQYVAPIKGAFSSWGVPTTRCYVTQRFCRYPDEHLLFETSQINLDIPYGDTFTVDVTWHVVPDLSSPPEEQRSRVTLHVMTPFSRSCLFRKIIETGVLSQSKESYQFVLKETDGELQRRMNSRRLRTQQQQHGSSSGRLSLPAAAAAGGGGGTEARGLGSDSAAAAGGQERGRTSSSRHGGGVHDGGLDRRSGGHRAAQAQAQAGPAAAAAPAWPWLPLLLLLLLLVCCLQACMLALLLRPGAAAVHGASPQGLAEVGSCHGDGAAPAPAPDQGQGQGQGQGGALQQAQALLQQLLGELGALQRRAAAAAAELERAVGHLATAAAPPGPDDAAPPDLGS